AGRKPRAPPAAARRPRQLLGRRRRTARVPAPEPPCRRSLVPRRRHGARHLRTRPQPFQRGRKPGRSGQPPGRGTAAMSGEGYFLYHSIGMYPGKAADMSAGLAAFAENWGDPEAEHWGTALGLRQRFIDRWRAIIGAPEGSLTTAENVTSAVAMLVGALPPERLQGKRLLIAADCFPSLHFLLTGLAPKLGFTLDTVPIRQGAAYVEDQD